MNEQDVLYPVGTEVQIKLESPYKHQGFKDEVKLKGVVTKCYSKQEVTDNHIYKVDWSNGYFNFYRPTDLELWQEEKPIVQELTSLPEKWCIAATKESRPLLSSWRTFGQLSVVDGYCYPKGYRIGEPNIQGYWQQTRNPEYTEITLDQFKKWVLKEPQQMSQEDIQIKAGDWVVRLVDGDSANPVTKGKVYKCQSVEGSRIRVEKDDKNCTRTYIKSNFRKALPHSRVCFYNREYFKDNREHEADFIEFNRINDVKRLDESEVYQYLPYHAWSVNIAETPQIVPNKVEKQTSVNKITSVDVKLIKPKQTIYF